MAVAISSYRSACSASFARWINLSFSLAESAMVIDFIGCNNLNISDYM